VSIATTDMSGAFDESAVARIARLTVTLLFLAWLVDYIDRLLITLALPTIGHAFSLDKAEQGLILTVFFLTYALFQLPGGMLADKIGARKTMTIALVGWSIFTGLTAVAFSYAWLLVIRAIFGVAEGIFPAASMKAITERTRPKHRLTANGLMLCSNALGSAVAPLVAGPALAYFGWRHSFFLITLLGVVMAVALWRYLPHAHPGATAPAEATPPQALDRLTIRQVLSSPAMWLVALTFCGFDIVAWGLVAWTPSYLMEVRHLDVRASGILTSIPFFVGGISTVIGGALFDRIFHSKPRLLIVPAMVMTGIFLWMMIHAVSVQQFILYESLAAGVLYLNFMPIYGLPLRLLPPALAGAGSGLVNFGGQFAGAISPFIMGALADRFSFDAAFSFLLVGVALAIVAALFTPQRQERFMATMN
jgi:sugar phosphate permease